jgi:hypothetical protein
LTTVLERPTTGPSISEDLDDEYFFFVGELIVGWTGADCWICAWKDGHYRWPLARMAVVLELEPADLNRPCRGFPGGPQVYLFFEGARIVGESARHCGRCAWQEGHPCWPQARFATEVPGQPGDERRPCLRRRAGGGA